MNFRRWLAIPLAGVAAIAIGIAAVEAAPSPSPSPSAGTSSTNYAQVFFQKLGAILHITITPNNVKQAELQTVQQMCNDQRLTAAQCSALQAKIQNSQGYGPFGGFGFRGGAFGARGALGSVTSAELNAAASALHMSTTDLQNALRSGKTLSDLETQQKVSASAVTTAMKNAAKGVLDNAVKAGTITQAQADAILARVGTGKLSDFGFRGGFKHSTPEPSESPEAPAPNATPAPSGSPATAPAAYFSTI